MARTMKAMVVQEPYKMEYLDVPVPEINDDEVLIKVKVCGICGSDKSIYMGKYAKEKLPFIPGHEFWGVIEETGKNVTTVKPGDRVAVDICLTCGTCYFCRHGDGLLCETFTQLGIHTDGGFAEYVKAPAKNCYLLPDSMDDDYLCAFVEPLTTVIHASQRMQPKISDSVAIIGMGLGMLHAQMAKARGCAPVIIVGTNADKDRFDIAREMGADYVINGDEEDPVEAVFRITNGVGADNVLEAVGSPETYEMAFKMLRRGGKLEAFGICAEDAFAKIRPYEFVLGEKKVSGSCAGFGNNWAEAIRLLEYGIIKPQKMFSMAIPLEELPQMMEEFKTRRDLIKVFVVPGLKERFTF